VTFAAGICPIFDSCVGRDVAFERYRLLKVCGSGVGVEMCACCGGHASFFEK
jgi:hypothetical protein